jgi:hypothetical protein
MQLHATNLAGRAGVLAAIFVVTFSGVLIALHEVAPPAPAPQPTAVPNPRVHRNLPEPPSSHKKSTRAHVNAASEKAKTYRPEQHDQVRAQLRPAIVTVSSPVAVDLGQAARIRLKIENDPAPGKKNGLSPGDQLDPIRTAVAEGRSVKVYQMQVSSRVTTHLFEGEHSIAPHEAETLAVPADGVAWTWSVPSSQLGRKALEFVMLAHVDAAPDPYPLGTLAIEMPVEVRGFEWVKYHLGELGTLWNWLVALATSLVAVTTAIPLAWKWLPLPHGRKEPEAQKVT